MRMPRSIFSAGWVGAALAAALVVALTGSSQPIESTPSDLIAKAREAYNNEWFDKATQAYGRYLELYPDGPDRDEAGFFHAQGLFLLGEFQEADRALEQEELKNRTYADQVLYYRGEIAAIGRDYERALVYFDRLIGEYPATRMAARAALRSAELHFRQGDAYLAEGAYSLALQNYQMAEKAPEDLLPLVKYKQGLCHYKLGDYVKAIQVWGDLSLVEGPGSGDAPLLARYRLARTLEERGHYSEAELSFQAFLDSAPDHYLSDLAREGLARVWAAQGRVEEAVGFWKKQGKDRSLTRLSSQYKAGLDHYLHEEYQDAEREFTAVAGSAEAEGMAWSARLWLARTCSRDNRQKDAQKAWTQVCSDPRAADEVRLECAEAMIESNPRRASSLAAEAVKQGGPQAGRASGIAAMASVKASYPDWPEQADEYLSRYPEGRWSGELFLMRADKRLMAGDLEGAQEDYGRAMKIHPDPEARLSAALGLAEALRQARRLESAGQAVEQARRIALQMPGPETRLARTEAEIAYDRGDYDKGTGIYGGLCGDSAGAACPPQDLFRLFWGEYRSGKYEDARRELARLSGAGGDWAFKAGFWEGMTRLAEGDAEAAYSCWAALEGPDPEWRGFLIWEIAVSQEKAGAPGEAAKTLLSLSRVAPQAGFYVEGEIMRLALEASDFQLYLSALPDPGQVDRETLSEEALLKTLRKMSENHGSPAGMEKTNNVLAVVATSEDAADEGTLLVAKAGLYGAGRPEAIAMLDGIIKRHPGSGFAPEIKFYRAEDSFFRKDYQGAVSWLEGVEASSLPEDLRFRFHYIAGQSYKSLYDLDRMRPHFLAMVADYADREGAEEWLAAGIGLTLAREFTPARTALDLCLEQARDRKMLAEASYWKGMVLHGMGDLDGAIVVFMSVNEKYGDQGMWVTTALYEAAGVHAEKEEYDIALDIYQDVLRRSRSDKKTSARVKAKINEVKKLKKID